MEQNGRLYLTSNEEVLFDNNYRYIISPNEIIHVNKKGTDITILDNFDAFCTQLLFEKDLLIKIIRKLLSCKSGMDKIKQICRACGNNCYLEFCQDIIVKIFEKLA